MSDQAIRSILIKLQEERKKDLETYTEDERAVEFINYVYSKAIDIASSHHGWDENQQGQF